MENVDPLLTVLGFAVTFIATFVTIKVKQDAAEKRYQEDNQRRDEREKDQDEKIDRQREDSHRHADEANTKREQLARDLADMRAELAGYKGSYAAINDRFISLERAVRDGFKELKQEINQRRRDDDRDGE